MREGLTFYSDPPKEYEKKERKKEGSQKAWCSPYFKEGREQERSWRQIPLFM
jgi:hypothetical protein